MVLICYSNPSRIQASAYNFLADDQGNKPPGLILTPKPGEGNSYPIKLLATGIPPGVNAVIHELHVRGFADVHAWSPQIKAQHPGEITRIMTKYFIFNS